MNLEINLMKYGFKYGNSKFNLGKGLYISATSTFKMCHARALSSFTTLKLNNFYIMPLPINERAAFHFKRASFHSSQILACLVNGKMKDLELMSCGELSSSDVGKFVRLRGFLQFQRLGQFAVIRDFSGLIQVIFKNSKLFEYVKDISYESYIEVIGTVALRPLEQVNKRMKTGYIEVEAETFNILNKAKKNLPFLIRKQNKPTESLALQYRYMDLRQTELQENLVFRSRIGKKMRDYLQECESFIELITPTLSNRTPGGAQEFIVPSRIPNHFYSLVQSPQTYKQLAMIGGFEKYFQFAVCYRDEGGEHDRQPEFMQLDLEMANTTPGQVKTLIENLIHYSWPDNLTPLSLPFPSINFNEAMSHYGTDKPDTRFDWKIIDVSEIISSDSLSPEVFTQLFSQECCSAKAFVIPNGQSYIRKKHMAAWSDISQKEANLSTVYYLSVSNGNSLKGGITKKISHETIRNLILKVKAHPEDIIVLAVGPGGNCLKALGKLRLLSAKVLESNDVIVRHTDKFNFLWVEEFPLFETNEQSGVLQSCHHPFTAPHEEDVLLLKSDPKQVRSQHYDLVLNGCEIAGGSIRIHNSELQKQILQLLEIDTTHFQFLIEALECGAPPHGGIALGFDRYISLLRKTKSIRDVIAFPKSAVGKCLMTKAPNRITNEVKELYHISTKVSDSDF